MGDVPWVLGGGGEGGANGGAGVTESYFQTKCREELAEVRERLAEVQQNVMEAGPEYIRHEQRYPGRIAKFMDQATDHLDEAERMIAAMAPGPQQKALWTSFRKTIQLADNSVRQALWDPTVQRDRARQKGTQKPRRPDINEWIEKQLRRQHSAKSPALWNLAPERITDQIGYGAFAKRVTNVRGELGLKRKNSSK